MVWNIRGAAIHAMEKLGEAREGRSEKMKKPSAKTWRSKDFMAHLHIFDKSSQTFSHGNVCTCTEYTEHGHFSDSFDYDYGAVFFIWLIFLHLS